MYLSTHLSHIETIKIKTHIHNSQESPLHWESLPRSTLHKQMLRYQREYDRREDLGGLSLMKTWGLASFKDYVAACITVHGGDMAEYSIPSDEQAVIVFSTHGFKDPSASLELFSWEIDPELEDHPKSQIAIIETVFEFEQLQFTVQSKLDHKIIYAAIIASMLVWDESRSDRLLAAERALVRLERLVQVDLTPEISCLRFLMTTSLNIEQARTRIKETTGSRSREDLSLPAAQQLFDFCSFCTQIVSWESLTEAYCVTGHQFSIAQPEILFSKIFTNFPY